MILQDLTALNGYITTLSQHGTHRAIAVLNGEKIAIKPLCQALKMRIQEYLGVHQHRIAWFKTRTGVVLMVSGNRVVTDVLEKFLSTYTGSFQEHQVLYTGTGVKLFKAIANDAFADYVPCTRSYGASR